MNDDRLEIGRDRRGGMPLEELRAFIDNCSDLFVVLDERCDIIAVNNKLGARLEYDPEELRGRSAMVLHPPEIRSRAREVLNALLKGRGIDSKLPLITKSRATIPVTTRCHLTAWRGKPVLYCVSRPDADRVLLGREERERDAVYTALIENAPYGIAVITPTGECLLVNSALSEILALPVDQVRKCQLGDIPAVRRAGIDELVRESLKTGTQCRRQLLLGDPETDEGQRLDCVAVPCELPGEATALLMVHRDTDEHRTRRMLAEMENINQVQIHRSSDAILILGESRFLDCNQIAVDMFRAADRDELVHMHPFHISPETQPDGLSSFKKSNLMMSRAVIEGYQRFEWMHRRLDGEVFPAEVTLAPSIYKGERVLHAHVQDLSERKQVESELLRIKRAIDSSSDAIGMATTRGRHFYQNAAFGELFGVSTPEALIDAGGAEVLYVDQEVGEEVFASITNGRPWAGETRMRNHQSGRELDILLRADAVRNGRGEIIAVVGIHTDITESKRTRRELARARDEADAANRAKSQFLANMSHEIRTPLTAILGFADLLEEGDLDAAERERYFRTIRRNGDHLLAIIKDILDLSRIESGKFVAERQEVSILDSIEEVVRVLGVRADEAGIELGVDYRFPLPERIVTDDERLRQILMGLVGNAVKFTPRGSVRVQVRYERTAEAARVVYDIVDTGIGMEEELLRKIFTAFAQADDTVTRRFGGTGLGLVIAQRLARALDGDIEVTSEKGVGSTFTLSIGVDHRPDEPLIAGEADVSRLRATRVETRAASTSLKGRVLLAEDVAANQKLASHILRRAGLTVDIAGNGAEACDMVARAEAESRPYDLILMDIMMPVMDGREATRKLVADGFDRPIIALTAAAMTEDRELCLAAGCVDIETKPYRRDKLLAVIAKHIARTPELV